jgi:hypothetical protein
MPDPTGEKPAFVAVRSGRHHTTGYICYVGYDVTAADIIDAAGLDASAGLVSMLGDFLNQVSQFKIGNVVAVSWDNGRVVVSKVADHPLREPPTPLP